MCLFQCVRKVSTAWTAPPSVTASTRNVTTRMEPAPSGSAREGTQAFPSVETVSRVGDKRNRERERARKREKDIHTRGEGKREEEEEGSRRRKRRGERGRERKEAEREKGTC